MRPTPYAYVNTIVRGDMSSLTWFASRNSLLNMMKIPDGIDHCTVYYAALNFRDVMLASGLFVEAPS